MKRTEVAYLWVASIMSNNATLPQEHVFLTLWLTQVKEFSILPRLHKCTNYLSHVQADRTNQFFYSDFLM